MGKMFDASKHRRLKARTLRPLVEANTSRSRFVWAYCGEEVAKRAYERRAVDPPWFGPHNVPSANTLSPTKHHLATPDTPRLARVGKGWFFSLPLACQSIPRKHNTRL